MSTKEQKIKEFLQTKRAPLDEWNTHEQLCLASAVACSGDQNWMSVSRALKGIVFSYNSRPGDWFMSKSCATQYGKLLESVETPKRKKRTASERDGSSTEQAPSTPVESLVKKLTTERIAELKKAIHEEQQMYAKLKEEVQFLQSSSMDETRIREMWNQIEQENIQKECEKVRHDQWLKKREERKLEHERQWRGPYKANVRPQKSHEEIEPDTTTQQAGTSPLLTSLLKSPSQAPTSNVQQSTVSSSSSNSARVAPTITNLLTTGSSQSSSQSPSSLASNTPLITQNPSAQNILINASSSTVAVPNVINSASVSSVVSSHAAPTLIDLLDKKSSLTGIVSSSSPASEKQQLLMSLSVAESSGGGGGSSSGGGGGGKEGDMVKDEEAELLADFNEIIDCEKFDIDEDLEDLNSIIMNPEILDEKISDGEPIKDADDSSQATSTDDYDKLKIKQIVETIQDIAGESEAQVPTTAAATTTAAVAAATAVVIPEEVQEKLMPPSVEESEVIQVPSEAENSEPASVEMIEAPVESNDSTTLQPKNDSPTPESKVVMISDESSNTNDNDKKEEMSDKIDTNDGDESQSAKSDDIKDPSGEDSNKETSAFQGIAIPESDENSVGSEKEPKESTTSFPLDDSDDAIFEDAREHHSGSDKLHESDLIVKEQSPEKSLSEAPETAKQPKTVVVTESEASHSAIDSDDEVIETEVKVSRSTGRKKAADSLKADTPSSSTRSRDHSENDDKSDSTPRTRSRHSSTAISESKATQLFPKEQDHNMWKAKWEDCVKELQKLKDYSQVVDSKILQDDFYKKICLHPMNMKMIGKNIENNVSTLKADIERDFVLMCTNIMMASNKGPKFDDTIYQFMRDGREIIDSHMRIDDAYKSYRKQIKKQVL